MKKSVEFEDEGQDNFENGWKAILEKNVPIADLIGDTGILTNFTAGHPISNAIEGYIFPEEIFKKLANNVGGKKIEGIAVKFGINSTGHLHLVFIPIEKHDDNSYTANYDDAHSTYSSIQEIVEFKDPILCIPPHKA